MSPEKHRDADTWGTRLLELVDQGLAPDAAVADFAGGLGAGRQEALPDVPCRGDVFHALYTFGRWPVPGEPAYGAMEVRAELSESKRPPNGVMAARSQSLARGRWYARTAEAKAIALAAR